MLPGPGCPKSPQFRARSAFCATLEGVEAPEGAFFGQAPPPVDCREISRPRAIHPGRAAFATRLRYVLSIFAISENYSLEVKNIWTMKRYLLAIAAMAFALTSCGGGSGHHSHEGDYSCNEEMHQHGESSGEHAHQHGEACDEHPHDGAACGTAGHSAHDHAGADAHNHAGGTAHNHAGTDGHDHAESTAHGQSHAPGIIEFSAVQAETAGLRTETVKAGPFSQVVKVSGEILPAQGDEITVVATTSGIVAFSNGLTSRSAAIPASQASGSISQPSAQASEHSGQAIHPSGQAIHPSAQASRPVRTALVPGARITSGSTVAWISSRNMAEGDQALKAKATLDAAAREYERASALVESGAISRKEFEQAQLDYVNARAAYQAYEGRSAEAGVAVKASLTGYVKEVYVNEGDYVNAGQPLLTITRNRLLQLRADVPQKYYAALRNVSDANFRPSYSDETYSIKALGGRLVSAGRSAAGTFYIPAIFEFSNTGDFVPGSYSDIYLIGSREDGIISVPESALLEEQGVYSVFVKVCESEYRKQEVRTGRTDGLRREILSGLNEGDEVVTAGTGQVRLASMSGVVPEGHSHNH